MRRLSAGRLKMLRQEFEILNEEGIIPDEVSGRIDNYYREHTVGGIHWVLIAFAILGALSIAGGIILILAHNWDIFGRTMRTLLSVLPVILGAVWSFIALKKNSVAWKESAGIFYSISVGASIALIGQTYHLPSDTLAFFATWMILVFPLMFVLSSSGSYLVYLALLCTWCCISMEKTGSSYEFWLFVIPAVVRTIYMYRESKKSPEALLSWYGLILLLLICLGVNMEKTIPGLWIVSYSFLLSLSCLLGCKLYKNTDGAANPLKLAGMIGIVIFTYLLTWEGFWDDVGYSYRRWGYNYPAWSLWYDVGVLGALVAGWAFTVVANFKKCSYFHYLTAAAFPIACSLVFFAVAGNDFIAALIFNAVLAFFGITYIVFGARDRKLRLLNWGMIIVSVLLFTRFMDDEFSFLARGIVFILIGASFLTANIVLYKLKNRKEAVR